MCSHVLRRASVPLLRLVTLLVVGVIAAVAVGSDGPAQASHTRIFFTPQGRVNPEPIIAFPNDPLNPTQKVDVRVENVDNSNGLGSFEFTFNFNPSVATVTNVQLPTLAVPLFLGSTGREVNCTTPTIDNVVGSVNVSCNTLTNTPDGPLGSGVLATITFQPATTPGLTTLALQPQPPKKTHLTDITGDVPVPHTTLNGSLRVAKCGNFDLTNTAVTISDILQLIQRFGTFGGPPPSANWHPRFDLNGDNRVDLGDLLIEVQQFGRNCTATPP